MKKRSYAETEKILYEYLFIKSRIEILKTKLSKLDLKSEKNKHYYYNPPLSSMGDIICVNEELKENNLKYMLAKELEHKKKSFEAITTALENLTKIEHTIISMKYFYLKSTGEISDAIGISVLETEKIRNDAIEKISYLKKDY